MTEGKTNKRIPVIMYIKRYHLSMHLSHVGDEIAHILEQIKN